MALLKKQEAISLELGDQGSLQRCYGNQALILKVGIVRRRPWHCLRSKKPSAWNWATA